MQVHCDEGVANHIGPEPCDGRREATGEASVGERAGQPLSRDSCVIPGADAVQNAEGNTKVRKRECLDDPAWSEKPHVRTLFAREPGGLSFGQLQHGLVRVGKASRSR